MTNIFTTVLENIISNLINCVLLESLSSLLKVRNVMYVVIYGKYAYPKVRSKFCPTI